MLMASERIVNPTDVDHWFRLPSGAIDRAVLHLELASGRARAPHHEVPFALDCVRRIIAARLRAVGRPRGQSSPKDEQQRPHAFIQSCRVTQRPDWALFSSTNVVYSSAPWTAASSAMKGATTS